MSARILHLPVTAEGRDLLRICVSVAGGWDFLDGTKADAIDWDQAFLDCKQDNADFEEWLALSRRHREGSR